MNTASVITFGGTIVAIVAILAGLTAYAINRLTGRNNHQVRHYDDICLHGYGHNHRHPHNHDNQYSPLGHNHDEDYSLVDHGHDDRYITRDEFDSHDHPQHVTRDEMDGRLAWVERTAAWFQLEQFEGEQNLINRGMLIGSAIGFIVGLILDIALPHHVFMNDATTTFHVDGQDIVQHLTSPNRMLYIGIPFACAFAGLVLGGFAAWIYQIVRMRQIRNDNRYQQVTTTLVTANDVPEEN
jgi:hypothetical protein